MIRREVYNREEKEAFFSEMNVPETLRRPFLSVGKYEMKNGKDVRAFSVKEMQDMFNTNFAYNNRQRKEMQMLIQEYVSWCKRNNKKVKNSIDLIDIGRVNLIRHTMVSSPKHLDIIMNETLDSVEEKSFDCLIRCNFWLAFFGVSDYREVSKVKVSEIDFTKMVMAHNGKYYEMYKEAIPALRVCCFEDKILYRRTGKRHCESMRVRMDNDYLMRSFLTESTASRSLMNAYYNRSPECILSYYNVYLSGVFYRLYELERMGIKPDFNAQILGSVNRKNNNDSYKKRQNTTRAMCQNLISKYKDWKKAFS